MKHSIFGMAALLLLTVGCMNVQETVDREYTPTAGIKTYYDAKAVPFRYNVMGTIQTSGNYNDFSRDSMLDKIVSRGEKAGADAILILGMRVVPSGTRVKTGEALLSMQTNDPVLDNSIGMIDRDFDGGYGAIANPNYGLAVTYNRVVRAQFLRYERGESGDFLPQDPNAKSEPSSEQPAAAEK